MWNEILKNPEKLRKITETAFTAIDINNNSHIQKSELQSVMRTTAQELGIEKPSKQQVKDVLKQLDSTNKGYLSKYIDLEYREDFAYLTQQVIRIINRNQQI